MDTSVSVSQDPDRELEGVRHKRPRLSEPLNVLRKDIFAAKVHWKELDVPQAEGCSEIAAAISGVSEVASHIICETTRKSYTQVYNQIVDYSKSLSPPVVLDITKESIPPAIIISYMRVLFTGAGEQVRDEDGTTLYCNDGTPRVGRGLAATTFRKHYHALRTLHVHFQQDSISKKDDKTGRYCGNSCNDPAVVRAFKGYLKMMKSPVDCGKSGRNLEGPDRAKVFEISQLLEMYKATRMYPTGPMLRAWTYVLCSCCLFLRKSEAANLKIGDIEVPCDRSTGKQLIDNGIPKYLFINIRRSKTDQEAAGKRLMLRKNIKDPKLCPVVTLMTWLAILRQKYGVRRDDQTIFCNLTQTERGKPMVMEAFRKMLSTLIDKAGLTSTGLRTHSCRRTAAYYAAWLGIPEATIKLYGRWESTVYLCYVEAADMDRRNWEDVREPGEKDPIREHFDVFGHLHA